MPLIQIKPTLQPELKDINFPWKSLKVPDSDICCIYSNTPDIGTLVHLLASSNSDDERKRTISNFINIQNSCFALVVLSSHFVMAAVDHIRSIPIFFSLNERTLVIGTNPNDFPMGKTMGNPDRTLVNEFLLTGYVHGSKTLRADIKSIDPGQALTWNIGADQPEIQTYFTYWPSTESGLWDISKLISGFDSVLNAVFEDFAKSVCGKTVWIPLSGGLDSRLVLTKALEHGIKDIVTFSYGTPGNHEIETARRVARNLGVEWICCPSVSASYSRRLFNHQDRHDYAFFSGSLQATPVYLDYEAVHDLRKRGLLSNDSCIVNGYSGDFLFGGHVPEQLLLAPDYEELVNAIIRKHCSHFKPSIFPNTISEIRESLLVQFSDLKDCTDPGPICAAYENWEWRERQPKAVVNGQRLYEFFNVHWALPLWDKRLVKFWSKVPLNYRVNQLLHLRYLRQVENLGAFSFLRSKNEVWSSRLKWISPTLQIINLLMGQKTRDSLYEKAFYFGFFHNQLSFFPFRDYNALVPTTRQPRVIPLATLEYLDSLGISLPKIP